MTGYAKMIAADTEFGGAPLLRREFQLETGHGAVRSATLTVSALGVVEARLNGSPVSGDLLTPGWTSYEWRLRYTTTDVAGLLEPVSVLGLALGNGWYRGRLGWAGTRALYGPELGAFAELKVTFEDETVQRVATDEEWTAGPGATLENDLYDGQTIDARRRDDAWQRPGFAGTGWVGVHALPFDDSILTPYLGPPVSRRQEVAPERIWRSPAGRVLVDFGQNLVGVVRVRVRGPEGSEVVVRHAEVLDHEELGVRPLRSAKATDRYILSGGEDEFEPTFTFHGFRYAEIAGWPGELDASALTAVVIGSELERIGTFRCSDPLLNRFHENVVWGMRGNFLDVPTDCPQRDERLGWTGDIAAFAPTAAFLFDIGGFLKDWLRDVDAEQRHHDGMIPFVVPDALKYLERPASFPPQDTTAFWSDAGVWVPWALWQAYGDREALKNQFESMTAHVRRHRLPALCIRALGHRLPVRRLARPGRAAGCPGTCEGGHWRGRHRLRLPLGRPRGPRGRGPRARRGASRDDRARRPPPRRVQPALRQRRKDHERLHHGVRPGIVFGLLDADEERVAADRLAELVAQADYRV